MGLCQFEKADVADRFPPPTDNYRRSIKLKPIDQIGGKERCGSLRTPFHIEILRFAHVTDGFGGRNRARPFNRLAGQHPALRTAIFKNWQADIEPRRVEAPSIAADQYGIRHRTARMDMRTRLRAGDPAAGPISQRRATVERKGNLEGDVGTAKGCPDEIADKAATAQCMVQAACIDPAGPQPLDALAGSARVGIAHSNYHPRDTRCDQGVGAGRSAIRTMRTGFERDICGCPRSPLTGLRQSQCLGMRASAWLGPAASDHKAILDE